MNLDDGQRQKVAAWIEEGLKLSEIQDKLGKELGVTMTYMDVRFLIDDLKLRPKDPAPLPPPPPTPTLSAPAKGSASSSPVPGAASPLSGGGNVSVTVDTIAKPNAMVSGRVTFSDGQGGAWLIDQMGRPGLVPDQQGYRPSPGDIAKFQQQLQEELGRLGF